jgi:glutamine synthetase
LKGNTRVHYEPLVMICASDISGRVRGKAVPVGSLPQRIREGVGWTPTNVMITAFGPIGDTPFGPLGDVMLLPDAAAEVRVDFGDDLPPEHFVLSDVINTDGTPWACCLRSFLKRAVQALRDAAGLRAYCAFEQEFVYTGAAATAPHGYAIDAFRRQGTFGSVFVHALKLAGIRADCFLPEYAPGQYEITCEPAYDLQAADRAVIIRELARASAIRLGQRATFTPILDPQGVGSGVHVHISLRTPAGEPAGHDPKGSFGFSKVMSQFVAGILHHLPALCAITAPSVISYIRLTPNRWAPTYANLAVQDREASVRVCPVFQRAGGDAASQFNIEFRPADAAASPYLALGAILWAGTDGIRNKRELPAGAGQSVGGRSAEDLAALGLKPLPRSLAQALDLLAGTAEAKEWFGDVLLDAYLRHKRSELALLRDVDAAEQCRRYAEVY